MDDRRDRARHVGYVMKAYPVLYHATVFNEIRALQRRGYAIDVFSLLEAPAGETRRDGIADLPKATYCWGSRLSRATVLRANASLLTDPGPTCYFAAYRMAREAALLGNLRSFMRLAAHARTLHSRGVRHWHAHWATEAASAARILALLTKLPFSFTAHAYDIFLQPQRLGEKLEAAEFAVTVSAYNRQFMADRYGAHLASKIHVIYPLIDPAEFTLRPQAPATGALSILSVGRLTEYKGLLDLVDACRILRDGGVRFTCRIVGEGEDRAVLHAAIEHAGLDDSVQLLGSLPNSEVARLLESATVFALPCVIARNGDRDGMPIVLIEAMARGVPVVATDVIGLPELVRDDVGILVPPHDPAALAAALRRIADAGPGGQEVMGRAGRRLVERELDAGIGAARLAALFEQRRPSAVD